jgi:plastocyanin
MKKLSVRNLLSESLMVVLFLSCSKSSDNYNNNNPGTTPGSTSNQVSITGMAFSAATTNIDKGVTVTWTNNDTAPHTVTADDNSFASGTLNKGDTYAHTFSNAGTFAYHCAIHTGMKAVVVAK